MLVPVVMPGFPTWVVNFPGHELQELEIKESPVKPQDVEVQSCSSEEVCGLDSTRAKLGRRLEMSSYGLELLTCTGACWWEKTNKRPKRKISRAVTGLALGATFY